MLYLNQTSFYLPNILVKQPEEGPDSWHASSEILSFKEWIKKTSPDETSFSLYIRHFELKIERYLRGKQSVSRGGFFIHTLVKCLREGFNKKTH